MAKQLSKNEAEFLRRFFAGKDEPAPQREMPIPLPEPFNANMKGWAVVDLWSGRIVRICKSETDGMAATRGTGDRYGVGLYTVFTDAAPITRPTESAQVYSQAPKWWHQKIIRQKNRELRLAGHAPMYPIIVRPTEGSGK